MSSKAEASKIENNVQNKIKLSSWMKSILIIFSVLVVLLIVLLIGSNMIQSQVKDNQTLPQIPFTSNQYFCSLQQDVVNTNYKKGTLLVVEANNSFLVGEKVLIKNKFADKQNTSINQSFLIGIIKELNQDQYVVTLLSYKGEIIDIDSGDIVGEITSYVPYAGYLFSNMIGIRGYIIFGIIPLLFVMLLFFILHYICIIKYQRVSYTGDSVEEKPLQISAQTIRSITKPNLSYVTENEEVKLFQVPQKIHNETSNEENVELETESIKIFKKEYSSKSIMLDEEDLNLIDEKQLKRIKMINNSNSYDIMKAIAEKNEQVMSGDDSNEAIELEKEESIPQIESQAKRELPRNLSADEIIQIYRNEKSSPVEEEQENQLNNIAKLYYDSNIENYN